MTETTAERLTRLLALLAYLGEAGAVPLADLAAHFSVSQEQILADIDLLWMTGLPGYMPGDLLDFSADELDGGLIRLTQDQGMAIPLRLSSAEAVAVQVALLSLAATADPAQRAVVDRVLDKLVRACGVAAAGALEVRLEEPDPAIAGPLRRAAARGTVVEFDYVTASDEHSQRRVEPWRVFADGGVWYVVGWCLDADAVRTFRLDRIGQVHPKRARAVHEADPHAGITSFATAAAPPATVLIRRPARWLADEMEAVARREVGDGDVEVTVRLVQPAWLRELVLTNHGQVEVLEPSWLREHIREEARAALDAYRSWEPA